MGKDWGSKEREGIALHENMKAPLLPAIETMENSVELSHHVGVGDLADTESVTAGLKCECSHRLRYHLQTGMLPLELTSESSVSNL